jgi:Holliday junction resolvase RusA-like endonuclease
VKAGPPLLSLYVDGVARPEGSMVTMPPAGRRCPACGARPGRWFVLADNRKVLGPWRKEVTTRARLALAVADDGQAFPLAGPLWARCDFTFDRPPSHPPDSFPIGRGAVGDVEKLVRAIYDSLTDARVWGDDAQVVQEASSKRYGPRPGVRILVGRMAR